MSPAAYRNAAQAEERFGDLAREYAAALSEEDEAGGAAMGALDALGSEGMDLLDAALGGGLGAVPDAPEAFKALLADVEAPPFEVDYEQLHLGARVLMRHGVAYAAATRQSLFWGYSNGAAIKPLAWTGEMRTADAALGRLVETGQWLHAVIRPGALRPYGDGWKATLRVRLLHARVRERLHASGRWDAEAWGAPLNRADSAFTLLEFSWMPLRLLRSLGFVYTAREEDAVYALWRLVGHLVGVPPALNPDSPARAQRLLDLRELTAGPPDEQSRELVHALLASNLQADGNALQRGAGIAFEALDRAVARSVLPAGYADALGIAPTRASLALPLIAGVMRAAEGVRLNVDGADDWLAARNEDIIRRGHSELKRRVLLTNRAGHGGRRRERGGARPATAAAVSG